MYIITVLAFLVNQNVWPKSNTFLVETTSLMVNTEKGNHMITAILGWIKSLLQQRRYQDSVEQFVASKHPTTTAEVEYWIREYDTRRHEWSL